jgi:predicted dehydrogenase
LLQPGCPLPRPRSSVIKPLRLGIVGANVARGWARDAHLPALRRLPQFTVVAVSARTQAIADEARNEFGASRAYSDSLALVRAPDVDVVAVTVKVPEHRAVVLAALESGKHVYCEWPLGRDLPEAQEMAAAVKREQHVMIGTQGLSAPAILHATKLARDGAVGRRKVLRVFSPTAGWGPDVLPHYAYLQNSNNGATLETIAGGHTLAAIEAIVGRYVEVDARKTTFVEKVRVQGSDELLPRTCADHMMVLGRHSSGCVSTLEVIGGVVSEPFTLDLRGERGWLQVKGVAPGGYQVGTLSLQTSFPCEPAPEPNVADLSAGPPVHVGEAYVRFARDIQSGTRTVPDFEDAVRLTRLLHKIDLAAETGIRQSL